jgi:Tfp pilus assembly protein PilF
MLMASYPLDRQILERDASRINSLERFARGDRKVARDFNQRGLQAFNNQDYRLAAKLFRQGVQADPGDIELAANLAFALMRGGEIDAAGQPLANALILNPRRTATWTPLAEYFVQIDGFNYAVRSLLVGYYYSRNQETTYRFYADKSQSEANAGLRRAYQAAFDVISDDTFGYKVPPQ